MKVFIILGMITATSLAAEAQLVNVPENKATPLWPAEKLAGTWMMKTKKSMQYEVWQKMDDKSMLCKSYRINGADTSGLEIVMLTKDSNNMYYTATVIGQNNNKPVRFALTAFTDSSYTFENPQHDFPKRIVYEFTDANSLHAFIDDGAPGKKRRDFYYNRSK